MDYGKGCIVLANTKKSFLSTIIRFFSRSRFSHTFVTMPSIVGVPMCAEDSSAGVDILRFDTGYLQNPSESIEIWQLSISDQAKDAGLLAVVNELEQGYAYASLPWFGWRWFNGLFGKDISNQNNWSLKNDVCSGLVRDRYMVGAGIGSLLAKFGKNSVWPEDISQVMNARPDLFVKVFSNF